MPTGPLPPWPAAAPSAGAVLLRAFTDDDVPMARDLATDPYVPLIGTLAARATEAQARDWVRRNRGRHEEGVGFSFAVAEKVTGRAVGAVGLWLADRPQGHASAGYSVAPSERGHGYGADALTAVTAFAWALAGLHRVELHVEPWNGASVRTAERAGYTYEGLLRRHHEIGGRRRDVRLYAAVRPGRAAPGCHATPACPASPRRPRTGPTGTEPHDGRPT